MDNNIKNLGATIGFMVEAKPKKMQDLLKSFGVSSSLDRGDLINKTISKIHNSSFLKSFQKLIIETVDKKNNFSGGYKNLTGFDDFGDTSFGSSGSSTTSGGGSFDWGSTIGGALSLAGGIFGSTQQNKLTQAKLKAEAENSANALALAKQQGADAITIAQLQLESQRINAQNPKNNTLLYVGIGLALVLTVGVIVMATRKK